MKEDNMFYSELGTTLKEWRKNKRYTLQEISEKMGKSKGWLNDVESGRNRIFLDDAIKLCGLYDKDIIELYNIIMK